MEFTFGIITDGKNDENIKIAISSILNEKIPRFEIIIVGNSKIENPGIINFKIIPFDDSLKPKPWITRKKNIIAQNAKYENIVMMHDYIKLESGWYDGFLKFGNSFSWCINKIKNCDNTRFRDYVLFYGFLEHLYPLYYDKVLLPYDFSNNIYTNRHLYISGSYYVIKKMIAIQYPLNEELLWGDAEDLEISRRLHMNNIIIKCNANSAVKFLKQKEPIVNEKEMTMDDANRLIMLCLPQSNISFESFFKN